MNFVSLSGLCGLMLMSCGCATVFEGTSQTIKVATDPAAASCQFEREGKSIGTLPSTPGTMVVRKSKYDITIKCDKEGFQQAAFVDHSGATATIAANIAVDVFLTAGISSIIDSADGADNKYDTDIKMSLVPVSASASGVSPTLQPSVVASAPAGIPK